MEQSQFEEIVAEYQELVSCFQSDYPTPELQAAANDYPAFRLPYSTWLYDEANELTQTQFAWICDNLTLYDFVLEGNSYNFSLLQKQTQLRFLKIKQVNFKDIPWVGSLTNLIELYIENTYLVDISALANCKKLKLLSLSNNNIEDISAIAACHQLRYLDLKDNPIKDIAALANLKKLERLYISLNNISSIEPLINLSNIQYLEIISQQSISLVPLSQLHSLIELTIRDGNLDDSCNFPLIPNLIDLNISNNKFTKLPPLPPFLECISFEHNKITDISPLADLKYLKNAFIGNNPITVPPPPSILKFIYHNDLEFSYPYGEPNKTLPPNAQQIWTLLMNNDPTNNELAEQLMIALQWDKADADAYTRMSQRIKY